MLQYAALIKRLNLNKEYEQMQQAKLLAAVYDANGKVKRGGGRFEAKDFLPGEEKQSSWQYQLQMATWINAAFGGKDLRKK